jgi:hypothetical protein
MNEKYKEVLGSTSLKEMFRVNKILSTLPVIKVYSSNRLKSESKYLWSHILTDKQKTKLINYIREI